MSEINLPVDLILNKLAEDAENAHRRTHEASKVLLSDLDTDLATTPCEVIHQEDRVKLKYYKPKIKNKYKTPLLVVYALINRETMLDLQPGRSVVQTLLNQGVEIYMIDWGYPTRKDRFQGIGDHINGYLDNMVDFVRSRCGVEKVNLMGICMGGTFSVIYSALHPDKVKNLITTVSPTNFDTTQGLLHVWMKHIDPDVMVKTYGNIPADVMNFGFLLLNPARLMIDKYVGLMENMDNKNFLENFVRMEKWIFDSPDLPGEVFREFIRDFYQKNLLIQNKLFIDGQKVNLKNITMPVINFYGKFDHLVPPEACEKLVDKVGTKDATNICLETGHIGIYVSSKCQKEFAPKIAVWLKERDAVEKPKKALRQITPKKNAASKPTTKKIPA